LIEEGRRLFLEETFDGNGRTCGTCHPPTNNFTIDPEFIRTLLGRVADGAKADMRAAEIRGHRLAGGGPIARAVGARSESWSRERRVVAKAEHLAKGSNPRFVVTSLLANTVDARTLYEDLYCGRGEIENRMYGRLPPCKQVFLFAQACVVGCCYVSGLVGSTALGPQ
jgi:hypothetical protein